MGEYTNKTRGKKDTKIKVADFETNNSNPTRVWLAGICNLDTSGFRWFNDLLPFMDYLKEEEVDLVYFHNAKFDVGFIIPMLLSQGYSFVANFGRRKERYKQAKLLQSRMGGFYEIQFYWGKRKMKIRDSYKIITQSVDRMAKVFGMDLNKRSINYNIIRPYGYVPTDLEIEYLKPDLFIVARALSFYLARSSKLTISSIAFENLYTFFENGENGFYNIFSRPTIEQDTFLRKGYFGGICKRAKLAETYRGQGYYLDVTSEYPYIMKAKPLPFGYGTEFENEEEFKKIPPLLRKFFVADIEVSAKLKPYHTSSIIEDFNIVNGNVMLEDTTPHIIKLTLCSVDIQTLYRDYDVFYFKILRGIAYPMKIHKQLGAFVDFHAKAKAEATNPYDRQHAKDMLNSASGRFGLNPKRETFGYYLDEEKGITRLHKLDESFTSPIAVYVVIAITAYGRQMITGFVNSNKDVYNRLLYIDTDSIHLAGTPSRCPLPISSELGGLKLEATFLECVYKGRKAYAIFTNGSNRVEAHISGINKKVLLGITKLSDLNTDNLTFTCPRTRKVVGGYMIVDTEIKKDFNV